MTHGGGWIALEIEAGGRKKIVGKVGFYPPMNETIIYREAKFADFFSGKTTSFSIDRAAAAWAIDERRATAMVCFCKDTRDRYQVSTAVFKNAVVMNLGERPQYRIPMASFHRTEKSDPFKIPYTANVQKIPALKTAQAARPATPPPRPAQASAPRSSPPRASKRRPRHPRPPSAQLSLLPPPKS